jgi:cell division protein ZipA
MGELRWILLGLGIPAIGAIWWWTARRPGQAPGNAELRESSAAPLHAFGAPGGESAGAERRTHADTREWGVPPLEPLSIRTADFERVPALDQPMMSRAEPLDLDVDLDDGDAMADYRDLDLTDRELPVARPTVTVPTAAPPPPPAPMAPPNLKLGASTEISDRLAAVPPQVPNASEKQRIVSVRVCSVGDVRWAGTALMAALERHGLAYGRYQVYHRKHSDGRSIFCVASLVEPGTFDIAGMAEEEFRGVTLFAVLPGPLEPVQTVDALLATARDLARELAGTLQDGKGLPLSPQRALALREDVARFQTQLP